MTKNRLSQYGANVLMAATLATSPGYVAAAPIMQTSDSIQPLSQQQQPTQQTSDDASCRRLEDRLGIQQHYNQSLEIGGNPTNFGGLATMRERQGYDWDGYAQNPDWEPTEKQQQFAHYLADCVYKVAEEDQDAFIERMFYPSSNPQYAYLSEEVFIPQNLEGTFDANTIGMTSGTSQLYHHSKPAEKHFDDGPLKVRYWEYTTQDGDTAYAGVLGDCGNALYGFGPLVSSDEPSISSLPPKYLLPDPPIQPPGNYPPGMPPEDPPYHPPERDDPPEKVPVPGTLFLFGTGLAALYGASRRNKR